jgi:hypothetical protein
MYQIKRVPSDSALKPFVLSNTYDVKAEAELDAFILNDNTLDISYEVVEVASVFTVTTECGACASHLLFISGVECRTTLNEAGSNRWVLTVPYKSRYLLVERMDSFNLIYIDVI